ncbi:MAG: CBS domain-containing protein [Candidatus Bathyarchaeota archaeon]|nr:CBS domain-containing protein [Candidatus Bathyarchaeota archaeon]
MESLKVRDVMTRDVVMVHPDETIEDAARLMTRYGISSLIVKDESGVMGILTERDVLTRVVASSRDPRSVSVSAIMTRSLISTEPDTTLLDAGRVMVENKIKKLPVIDIDEGDVIGILSLTDVAIHQPDIIKEYKKAESRDRTKLHVHELIKMDEGGHLEFKASLRYNNRRHCLDPDLEYNCLKTLCAFLNAEGGDLLIGVADNKRVVGLSTDYDTFTKKNRDGFENYLINQISYKIGNLHLKNIKISFHSLYGREICRINVKPSKEPAFLNHRGKQTFYVRTGNGSRPFKIAEAAKYMVEHWPEVMNTD